MITMGKKFKKSMAMAMATAMALSVPALPVYQTEKVEAAEQKVAEVTSDFETVGFTENYSEGSGMGYTETLTVERKADDNSKVFYYAVAKTDKDGKLKKYPSAKAYETVEFGESGRTSVDLSWVSRKSKQILLVTTGTAVEEIKPLEIELPAQDTVYANFYGNETDEVKKSKGANKESVIGNDADGYLTFGTGDKKNPDPVSASAVQYRTINGDWAYIDDETLDLGMYSKKGATLQMRIAPSGGCEYVSGSNEKDNGKYDGTPAGKIVNVKIKAKSAGPKVTLNYNDKQISVPKSVEYSLDGKVWKSATTTAKATKDFSEYGWNGSDKVLVYYRTAGDKKKSASKITYLEINKDQKDFAELVAPLSGSSIVTDKPAAGSKVFDVRYKTAYDAKSGLEFTNTTEDMYQVALVKKADEKYRNCLSQDGKTVVSASCSALIAKSNKGIKWTTVNAESKGKAGTGKITLGKNDNPQDYVILYRICDKKGEKINSEVRVMDMPAAVQQDVCVVNDAKAEVKAVEWNIASGDSITLTVSASGIVAKNPRYSTGIYQDEACKTKYSNVTFEFTAPGTSTGSVKLTKKAKIANGTYYVKVAVEGVSTVVKVTITGVTAS